MENTNFSGGGFGFGSGNFDPLDILTNTSTVKLMSLNVDVSPSIEDYVDQMNQEMHTFLDQMKKSHHGADLVLDLTTFTHTVQRQFPFKPILNVDNSEVTVKPQGRATALYQATYESLREHISYRKQLEQNGGQVKSVFFIVTDGLDNVSGSMADEVKKLLKEIRSNEWEFDIFMFGVGKRSDFEKSCLEMGLNPQTCLTTGNMKEMITVLSQSVSSSTNNVTF